MGVLVRNGSVKGDTATTQLRVPVGVFVPDKFAARPYDNDLSIVVPLNACELRVAGGDIEPPADAILTLVERRTLLA